MKVKTMINSLKAINQLCMNTENCSDCPFRNNLAGGCYIRDFPPFKWEFKDETEKVTPYVFKGGE